MPPRHYLTPDTLPLLTLPPFAPRIKASTTPGRWLIFDFLRRRYVTLTSEEWVRQAFTRYLVSERGFPQGLLANEVTLNVMDGRPRRVDSVLYDHVGGRPRVIVEYKAPRVRITRETFQQIYAYNVALRADYLIVTNGLTHYCLHVDYDAGRTEWLTDIPVYDEIIG